MIGRLEDFLQGQVTNLEQRNLIARQRARFIQIVVEHEEISHHAAPLELELVVRGDKVGLARANKRGLQLVLQHFDILWNLPWFTHSASVEPAVMPQVALNTGQDLCVGLVDHALEQEIMSFAATKSFIDNLPNRLTGPFWLIGDI